MLVAATTAAAGMAFAQGALPDLQDMVGWRGSAGERVIGERGYTLAHGRLGDDGRSVLTFWHNARSDACVRVTTLDGQYQSVDVMPPVECRLPVTKPQG